MALGPALPRRRRVHARGRVAPTEQGRRCADDPIRVVCPHQNGRAAVSTLPPVSLAPDVTDEHVPFDRSFLALVGDVSKSVPVEFDLGRLGFDGVDGVVLSEGSEARDMVGEGC